MGWVRTGRAGWDLWRAGGREEVVDALVENLKEGHGTVDRGGGGGGVEVTEGACYHAVVGGGGGDVGGRQNIAEAGPGLSGTSLTVEEDWNEQRGEEQSNKQKVVSYKDKQYVAVASLRPSFKPHLFHPDCTLTPLLRPWLPPPCTGPHCWKEEEEYCRKHTSSAGSAEQHGSHPQIHLSSCPSSIS